MNKTIKNKIIMWITSGFIMPPLFWVFIIRFTEVFNNNEIISIATNPILIIYVLIYIFAIVYLLKKKLDKIEILSNKKKNNQVQKKIYDIIISYIIGMVIYAIIGPNMGMIGLNFEISKHILGWSFGIPIIFIYAIPFFLFFISNIENWTISVHLSDKSKIFSLKSKIYISAIISSSGIVFVLILSIYSLISNKIGDNIILDDVNTILFKILIIGAISIISIIIPIVLIISKTTNQINILQKLVYAIINKNKTSNIIVQQRDEIGLLAVLINTMNGISNNMINNINDISISILNASNQLSSVSEQISERASEQAATTEEIATSMEQMLAMINSNSQNAEMTGKASTKSANEMKQSNEIFVQTIKSVSAISEKISIITEIANKTDILSINAAIEAARAGESGKGFSVVANEIRKLADKTKIASDEITKLSKNGQDISRVAGEKLKNAIPEIIKSAELVNNIVSAGKEQQSGVENINISVQQLTEITNENSASAEEMSASAEELSAQAEQLKELISVFKIGNFENKKNDFNISKTTLQIKDNQQTDRQLTNRNSGHNLNLSKNDKSDSNYEKY